MIQIRGLRKRYGEHEVLSGIDARVDKGQIVGIVGPSGCGKSTLLRCLNGLEPFQDGSISVAGFDLGPHLAAPAVLKQLRCAVGMVFQDFQLFPHLSALENVTLAPRVVRRVAAEAAEKQGLELLERVGLQARARAHPAQLSGGQKQRVAIARALAQGVRVLLLDEPTSALDPEMREEVREVLKQVAADGGAQGEPLTMVLVTHDMRLASELAQNLWVMAQGRIERSGPVAELSEFLKG